MKSVAEKLDDKLERDTHNYLSQPERKTCSECGGSGWVGNKEVEDLPCGRCNGTGIIEPEMKDL